MNAKLFSFFTILLVYYVTPCVQFHSSPARKTVEPQILSTDDSTENEVEHIIQLFENLNSVTSDNRVRDDTRSRSSSQSVVRNPRSTSSKLIADTEYKQIDCDFQCFLRPILRTEEKVKLRQLVPYLTDEQISLLDCMNNHTSPDPNHTQFQIIPVQCITHFTARLVHIVVNNDAMRNHTDLINEQIIFVANNLGHFIRDHIITHWKPFTDLYLTINLPLFGIDRYDMEPLTPWLRYLALDGIMLRFTDVMSISNLSLNYFVLQGCNQYEESVNNPTEISLPDPEISTLNLKCLVLWRFACPNLPNLVLMADQNAHHRLCRSHVKLTKTTKPPNYVKPKIHLRLKRSSFQIDRNRAPKSTSPNLDKQDDNLVNWHQPFYQLQSNIEKCLHKFEQTCREDIYWYRTIFCVLLGILLLMVLFTMGTVIVVCHLLRQISLNHETKVR